MACGAQGAAALPKPDSQDLGGVLGCMLTSFLEYGNAHGSVGFVSSRASPAPSLGSAQAAVALLGRGSTSTLPVGLWMPAPLALNPANVGTVSSRGVVRGLLGS